MAIRIPAREFLQIDEGDFDIVFDHFEETAADETSLVGRFVSEQTFSDHPLRVRGAPPVELRSVSSQIAVRISSITPLDDYYCGDSLRRYVARIDTLPGSGSENTLHIEVAWGLLTLPIDDVGINLQAMAGGDLPPPPPLPPLQVGVRLSIRRSCETRVPSRITGSVLLNRVLEPSDGTVNVAVSATAGGRAVIVTPATVRCTAYSRRTFQVRIPPAFTGIVHVTATSGTATGSDEIYVVKDVDAFCLAPEMYLLADRLRVPVFPCPALQLNDVGDLVGIQDGWMFRQGTGGPPVYLRGRTGGEVRHAAMNAFGEVAGSSLDEAGKLHGFIILPEEFSAAIVLDDVQFRGINDDGLAVGYRRLQDNWTAFVFALARPKKLGNRLKGKSIPLALPKASRSEAAAVNNLGQIVMIATVDTPKIFVSEKMGGELKEMGDIGPFGNICKLTDSGFVLGNEFVEGKRFRPFLISVAAKKGDRFEVPVLKGYENALATDVDERGTVVGRAFMNKNAVSRGFRFTVSRGTEDLNDLVKLDKGEVITAAVCTNRRGELVVEIASGDEIGYALLKRAE
ncbi:MAG TPA: hypothetical protein VGW57_14760 [Chthoniobacterales bacterium]|nr:hypothetical protein [Chthoniobacterales bacterium]